MTTTVIFAVEAALKIFCYGLVFCGDPSYLRSAWNILDFVIMILSVIGLTPLLGNVSLIKTLRIMRVVRLIGRQTSLKIGLYALIRAMPNALRIIAIMLIFFIVFGIVSVSKFKGTFNYCQSTEASSGIPNWSSIGVLTKWDCINAGGDW
jgi:hypothetical protein